VNDRSAAEGIDGADARAELEAGRAELTQMAAALDAARSELDRSGDRHGTDAETAGTLREVLSQVVPEIDRPAMLIDGDLWVIACNQPAAAGIGRQRTDAVGSSLARWPHALERTRAVRTALGAPAGPLPGDHGDVAVSLGLDDDALPSSQRMVLLLLGS
jgi:PAS domain-containing protein